MVQNDGTKPVRVTFGSDPLGMAPNPSNWQWIWVMGLKLFTKDEKMDEANKEASRLCMKYSLALFARLFTNKSVREVTANVEAIQVCSSACECIVCALKILIDRPDNSYTRQHKNWSKKQKAKT